MDNKNLETGEEDFEIVNDSPNVTVDESEASMSQNSIDKSRVQAENGSTTENVVSDDLFKTFELIQKECSTLKEELTSEHYLIKDQIGQVETQKRKSLQKVEEMNDRMRLLVGDTKDKDEQLQTMQSQMESYKEASEKSDEVCAKMCEAEENFRFYKNLVHEMRKNVVSATEPDFLVSDACLARDLEEKETKIRSFQRQIQEKDDELMALKEDNLRLRQENDNFENLVVALHAQVEQDQSDIQHVKSTYDRRINELNVMIKRRDDRSDNSEESCPTVRENQLTHNEHHSNRRFECERCHLRLPTSEIFEKHVARCPTLVDSVF